MNSVRPKVELFAVAFVFLLIYVCSSSFIFVFLDNIQFTLWNVSVLFWFLNYSLFAFKHRYIQIKKEDVDTELLQDAARKEGQLTK